MQRHLPAASECRGGDSPRDELTRLQAVQVSGGAELRSQIMESMLVCCGELGYRQVSVERVYRHYGGSRNQFYRHFGSKQECFAAAYEGEGDRICGLLLDEAERGGGKRDRLTAALESLASVVNSRPAVARAMFVEVHVAGGAALRKRHEIVERLSRALEDSCHGTGPRQSPPRTTAEFIIGAIEQAVCASLLQERPEDLDAAIPELASIVRSFYARG